MQKPASVPPERWVFGDYIVFASDIAVAQAVFKAASETQAGPATFGSIVLDDGQCGNWVMVGRSRALRESR